MKRLSITLFVMCMFAPTAWAGQTVSRDTKDTTTFQISVISADIELVIGARGKVIMTVDGETGKIDLVPEGKVLRAKIERKKLGAKKLGDIDRVHVEVPAGTHVEVRTVSGDVKLGALAGNTTIKTVSGDVQVAAAAANLEINTVSGDVRAENVSGSVRIKTVSGDVSVLTKGAAANALDFSSTSGDVRWTGVCAKGCRINTQTLSGDTTLVLGQASSMRVLFKSFSGEVNDGLGLTGGKNGGGFGHKKFDAVYKNGDGLIDCSTHSGDITLRKQ